MGFLVPGVFIRKSIQIGHLVQTTKPYFLQTLLRSNLQNRQRFFLKKITMVCKKSPEFISQTFLCQTFKPSSQEARFVILSIAIKVLRTHFIYPRPRILARIVRHR
jgi:hypothetical protein